jgi:Flp pilus assembly pilin Flp
MSQPQQAPEPLRTAAAGSAPTAIEYAIIAVLIAAVAVGTWKTFGEPPQGDDTAATAAP